MRNQGKHALQSTVGVLDPFLILEKKRVHPCFVAYEWGFKGHMENLI